MYTHTLLVRRIRNESYHIHECVMSHIWMSHIKYVNESYHTNHTMPYPKHPNLQMHKGWRRIIGCLVFIGNFPQQSLIISVSFAENELQIRASCGSSPLYRMHCQKNRNLQILPLGTFSRPISHVSFRNFNSARTTWMDMISRLLKITGLFCRI